MVRRTAKKPAGGRPKANAAALKATKAGKQKLTQSRPEPATGLSKAEITKIQGLLKTKTFDGVAFGLSLLESLCATQADYEKVFTQSLIKSVLDGWMAESWGAIATALVPHERISKMFQRLAEEKFRKRPRKLLINFQGLQRARIPIARAAFLAAWGGDSGPQKPFVDLVKIPAGSFLMGSPEDEADRRDDENQVRVRITRPFQIGRTVVTQGQWRAVMGTEPWREFREYSCVRIGEKFPAVFVTWHDAEHFCHTLTELEREVGRLTTRQSYRLPTEAEWEYACRAATTTSYFFGDSPAMMGPGGTVRRHSDGTPTGLLHLYAWYFSNSDGAFHPVAQKQPNPWGLYDMYGNVMEWCMDWYADKLAGGDDPVGRPAGADRVCRGGYWHSFPSECRSAARGHLEPSRIESLPGFRVVCCG